MSPVVSALAYHHLFQDPLTIEQIHQLLITSVSISLASVRRSVEQLLRHHRIIQNGRNYALPGFSQQNIRQHGERTRASREKIFIARRAARCLSFIPWVKLVAVTGALAMENADESDDIDLMIVTDTNRLWLTRPIILLLTSIFFKRRKPIPLSLSPYPLALRNALCLNLWIDEDALIIPKYQRNLYTAHELAQMIPLVNRNRTYEWMISVNAWGRKFLANAWEKFQVLGMTYQVLRGSRILDTLNYFCYKLQRWYMLPKMTTERVSLHAAYFHPGNRSREILLRYSRILGTLGLSQTLQ